MQDAWTARKAEEIRGYTNHNEVFLHRDQGCLQHRSQRHRSSSQRRRNYPTHREDANSATMGRALQRRPQPFLTHLRRRHRPSVSIGDQHRPRTSAPSPRNHQDREAPLQRESARIRCDFCRDLLAQQPPNRGSHDNALLGEDATIVRLYKRKGNRQLCDNHRGISLLHIAGKIFARILLNRLNSHLERGLLTEIQCCFGRHRGTTDIFFAARQLQEKCQEMPIHSYYTSVDLMRTFDSVNREGL
ncbi:hypothetical protein SprV_0100211300 [Sparganum proliferum]